MRYLGVLLVGILILAWIPGSVSAQGLLPAGLGLPSFGGILGGGGCAPLCDPKVGGGLDFWVGYLATDRSVVSELGAQENDLGFGNFRNIRRQFAVQGPWLALSARGSLNEQVGLFARGTWLVASRKQSDERLIAGSVEGAFTFIFDSTASTRPQWYTIEAAGFFSFSPASLIAGFRFDAFQTTFTLNRVFLSELGFPGDYTDLTVTSYIPYVGLMVQQGPYVKVGLIGFPYVPGHVKYREALGNPSGGGTNFEDLEFTGNFRRSYFLEAFAEYSLNLTGASVGIFGIWTYLHVNADVSGNFTAGPGIQTAFDTQPFDFTFDRQNWIFGGKFGINFVSPL